MTFKRLWTDEQLVEATQQSNSFADVARFLGLRISGGSFRVLKKYIEKLQISTEHFHFVPHPKQTTETILVENSSYLSSSNLKERLLKEDLLINHCYECGILEWTGKKLSLHLDHINGVRNDNRLENLRLLCPNCHSLTPTYCKGWKGLQPMNVLVEPRRQRKCIDCNVAITNQAQRCVSCTNSAMLVLANTKIIWPTLDELEEMVKKTSYLAAARKLGVSDRAVRNRLHKRGRLIQR